MATTAPIRIPIIGDDKFTKKWKRIGRTVSKVGAGMQSVGRASMRFMTLPILMAGAAAVKVGADFDFAMRKVEAKVNIGGKSIKELRDQAKGLGRTTMHTAREVAGAQEKLAMAGWDSLQVFKALPDALSLSTATSHDLIEATDILSNVMQAYQIEASESGRVSDVFAAVVSGTNVDMEMLSDTMKYAAPVARSFGTSLEDTAAAAGFLGNMGIQGSLAGTALRTAFVNLAAPTAAGEKIMKSMNLQVADEKTGKMRNFKNILTDLSSGLKNLTTPQRIAAIKEIFGKRAIAAALPMVEDVDKFNSSLKRISKTLTDMKPGKAQEMVNIMGAGATGAMKRFTSALEGMAIAFAESGLLDAIAGIAENMAKMFKRIAELSPETKQLALRIALIAAAAGPFLLIIGKLVSMIGPLIPLIAGAGGMAPALAAVGAALTGPVGLAVIGAIAAFAGLTAATIYLWDEIKPIRVAFAEEIPRAFGLSTGAADDTSSAFSSFGSGIKDLVEAFAPIGGVITRILIHFNMVAIWFKTMKFLLTPIIWLLKNLFKIFSWGARVLKDWLVPKLESLGKSFGNIKNKILDALGPFGDLLRFMGLLPKTIDILVDKLTGIPDKEIKIETVGDVFKKKFGAYESGMLGLEGRGQKSAFEKEYEKIKAELDVTKVSKVEVSFKDLPKGTGISTKGEVTVLSDTGPIMEGAI